MFDFVTSIHTFRTSMRCYQGLIRQDHLEFIYVPEDGLKQSSSLACAMLSLLLRIEFDAICTGVDKFRFSSILESIYIIFYGFHFTRWMNITTAY